MPGPFRPAIPDEPPQFHSILDADGEPLSCVASILVLLFGGRALSTTRLEDKWRNVAISDGGVGRLVDDQLPLPTA
jgi:hypothetical protein